MTRNSALEGSVYAPEFPTRLAWLNTDRPLSLRELRGKIVLLDFWTFCCINCMHVIPDLKRLEEKYKDELVVVGVHSAKFSNEKDTSQIRQAILRYGIAHPVVNDNNFEVWQSYAVHAWPTLVLINPNGRIIGTHSGEGIYEPFDAAIGQAVAYFGQKGELKRGPLNLSPEASRAPEMVLAFPGKVSADAASRSLFISDTNHNRIIVTDPDGAIREAIGSGAAGLRDGSFEEAEFRQPQGTALAGDVLYIADTENHAIRAADLRTRRVTTVLGTGKQARQLNMPGRGTAVSLSSPWDLVAHGGKLYIAMAGTHQLWAADMKTWDAAPFAGTAQEARVDGPLQSAALAQPSGITTDGARLYFADSETSSIRAADLAPGGRVRTLIGEDLFEFGDRDGGRGSARLQHPLGVLFREGLLYVADTYNSKIKVVDPARDTSTTFAGTGKPGFSGGARAAAQFNEPGGLAALGDTLYVADTNNHRIRTVDLKHGEVKTLELTNLARLAQAKPMAFHGRVVELPAARIGPGAARLSISLALPAGYKLNKDAPQFLDWHADGGGVRFERAAKDVDLHTAAFPLEVPLTALPGKAGVNFDAVIYYCTEASTECLVDRVSVRVPVEVTDAGARAFEVRIPVRNPNGR